MMASCSRPTKEAEGESTTGPNWLELPRDVTAKILLKLSVIEIVTSASLVCPLWRNICKDPHMWSTIDMLNLGILPYDLVKICRYVVDQSCGHVEDISIEGFGTDELLQYIADRASKLRRIQLTSCRAITEKRLSEVATKFPLLEELDISFSISNLSKDSLEVIGQSCPLLKTLKFKRGLCYYPYQEGTNGDNEAFAIAKNMPKLHQLQLMGIKLSNDGLVAILDGCPYLESLDLRYCYHVDLYESLEKRCIEQIKNLRLPDQDHISDDENSYGFYCECGLGRDLIIGGFLWLK